MSYYRYITGVYKSYWPELNRTLRSSSVPRHIPEAVPFRASRASSVPPSAFYSNSFFSRGTSATPFRERSLSIPRQLSYSYDTRSIVSSPPETHYSDFDYKVINYMGKLDREDTVRSSISQSRMMRATAPAYPAESFSSRYNSYNGSKYSRDYVSPTNDVLGSFSSRYNYYDGNKHGTDYLYPTTKDVLGSWKHYNLSGDTLNYRNMRSRSPLVTREINRYYEKKQNYIGSLSSSTDFSHYNCRRTPYFGGSDDYQFMKHRPFQTGRGY